MKLNQLFTSMLAVTAVVVTSCSTPRVAQQGAVTDDVYNSNAQAKVYVPAPVRTTQPATQEYQEDDYYGTSDPYYDMDYSSRINRFSYGSPWRSYYDPYFNGYNDFYGGYGGGFGGGFGIGLGWGSLYSPFYGYNNWGFNNWGYNNFGYGNYYGGGFGGGYYGGGFLGGGYYGGGYYTGRTTNVPEYKARPYLGRENGVGTNRGMARSTTTRSDVNGNRVIERSRSERFGNDRNQTTQGRVDRSNAPTQSRPTRTESAPARSQPTYSPPARSDGGGSRSSGGSSSSGSSGGGGGGARPTRAGRG
ncbi:MAG: hypothetical protein WKF66_12335 [Pedobacter sp.]